LISGPSIMIRWVMSRSICCRCRRCIFWGVMS